MSPVVHTTPKWVDVDPEIASHHTTVQTDKPRFAPPLIARPATPFGHGQLEDSVSVVSHRVGSKLQKGNKLVHTEFAVGREPCLSVAN